MSTRTPKIFPQGFYVYALVDPVNEEVFYVGKGCKSRPLDHLKEAKALRAGKCVSNVDKCERILKIIEASKEVEIRILGVFKTEAEAYAFEKKQIGFYGASLTNAMSGTDPIERLRSALKHALGQALSRLQGWIVGLDHVAQRHRQDVLEMITYWTKSALFYLERLEACS